MPFNINTLTERGIYTIYDVYKTNEKAIEVKDQLTENDRIKLIEIKENLKNIEIYTENQRSKGIRWSLISLYQDSGFNPTLILEFYPGSECYKNYGRQLVVNVEYSEEDLKYIISNLNSGIEKIKGLLRVKTIPELNSDMICTGDIFAIQSAH